MENSKIPTAEQFCNEYLGFEEYGTDVPYFMIEFARMHVKAALEEADGEVPLYCSEGVLNCYPPERIK